MATKNDLMQVTLKQIDYLPEEDVRDTVNAIIECLASELEQGNNIEIRGFGSFSVRKRKYAGSNKNYNTVYYRATRI
jgi:integration host factor subunit beta